MLDIDTGRGVLEVIGQVNNFPATADAPLGSSQQFGYVSNLDGIETVFTDPNPAGQNESSAMLTFFTDVKTVRVTANGPFTIIIREGTTTFYRNTAPASFSSPDSFQSGEPVVSSTIRQQVILDTVEKTFTVVNENTITGTKFFELGDDTGSHRLPRGHDSHLAHGRAAGSRRRPAADRTLCRKWRRHLATPGLTAFRRHDVNTPRPTAADLMLGLSMSPKLTSAQRMRPQIVAGIGTTAGRPRPPPTARIDARSRAVMLAPAEESVTREL